jgi:hypothetical protein
LGKILTSLARRNFFEAICSAVQASKQQKHQNKKQASSKRNKGGGKERGRYLKQACYVVISFQKDGSELPQLQRIAELLPQLCEKIFKQRTYCRL